MSGPTLQQDIQIIESLTQVVQTADKLLDAAADSGLVPPNVAAVKPLADLFARVEQRFAAFIEGRLADLQATRNPIDLSAGIQAARAAADQKEDKKFPK